MMKDRETIVRHLWRITKRWRWIIASILTSLLMTYVLLWMDNPLMEMYFGAVERAAASYFLLFFCFFITIALVLYELHVEVKTYYICESCHRNFAIDGHYEGNLDAQCPFCSSKNLHFVVTVEKKEKQVSGSVDGTSEC